MYHQRSHGATSHEHCGDISLDRWCTSHHRRRTLKPKRERHIAPRPSRRLVKPCSDERCVTLRITSTFVCSGIVRTSGSVLVEVFKRCHRGDRVNCYIRNQKRNISVLFGMLLMLRHKRRTNRAAQLPLETRTASSTCSRSVLSRKDVRKLDIERFSVYFLQCIFCSVFLQCLCSVLQCIFSVFWSVLRVLCGVRHGRRIFRTVGICCTLDIYRILELYFII